MIKVTYVGGDRLRIEARGHEFFTDQPVDDGGEDTAPTPTEVFVSSLTACIGFYAERFLRRNNLSTAGLSVVSEYRWAQNPHHVGEIDLMVEAPALTQEKQAPFLRVIGHCTVHNTLLHPPHVRLRLGGGREAAA